MLDKILNDLLPSKTTLVAVSKTKPTEAIMNLYDQGQRIFGENKVQEVVWKQEELPKDIEWHLIGHLQTNKVKYIAPFVALIHSVDSLKLLKEINKQAAKNNRIIDVLLQFHIATESSKFGLNVHEAKEILNSDFYKNSNNINVVGVMGMATFTDNQEQIKAEFNKLKLTFDDLKNNHENLNVISMGMSGDYQLAISCGSNMVRIGSSIFGERNY